MSTLRGILLLNFQSSEVSLKTRLWIQVAITLIVFLVLVIFSYNSDWKRWLSLLAFIALLKMGIELARTLCLFRGQKLPRTKELFEAKRYKDNSEMKRTGTRYGLVLLCVYGTIALMMYGSYKFLESELNRKGVKVKAFSMQMQWRSSADKDKAGFYMTYCYRAGGERHLHKSYIGRKSNIKNIQVTYLPYLPNVHRVSYQFR